MCDHFGVNRLSIAQCRRLIEGDKNAPLTDEQVTDVRDMLYSLAEVIADAFTELQNIDQSAFNPPGDIVDQFSREQRELVNRLKVQEVPCQ